MKIDYTMCRAKMDAKVVAECWMSEENGGRKVLQNDQRGKKHLLNFLKVQNSHFFVNIEVHRPGAGSRNGMLIIGKSLSSLSDI